MGGFVGKWLVPHVADDEELLLPLITGSELMLDDDVFVGFASTESLAVAGDECMDGSRWVWVNRGVKISTNSSSGLLLVCSSRPDNKWWFKE